MKGFRICRFGSECGKENFDAPRHKFCTGDFWDSQGHRLLPPTDACGQRWCSKCKALMTRKTYEEHHGVPRD